MRPVLSPAEVLGLSGAALEGRVRSASHDVPDIVFARLADRLRADAWSNRLIYEHEGVEEAVRIMLRPLLVMPEQLSYVHHVCLQLIEALKRLPGFYLQDERVRRILAITKEEEAWFRDTWTTAHERFNSIYGRLDAVCDFTGAGWQDSLKFMEPNLTGVGGIHFSPVAEELVMRDVVPTLFANNPSLNVNLPRDQRDLFVQLLIDHARTIGRDCQLCFVDPKYVHDGPSEQGALSTYLSNKHGLTIAHADPRELRVVGEEVYYEDIRIDVAYRDFGVLELVEYEQQIGQPLEAMRLLFRQNRIVSSMVGEFDHKSAFEILTEPSFAENYFGADDLRLFRRHVLWTRLVGDRDTTLPDRRESNLLRYARNNRELLVLKPNRSYGGQGVAIGAATSQDDWERLLDEAATLYEDPERSSVLQLAARLPVHEFPVVGADGRVFAEPFYAVMGFAATENGLGTMCRVSQKQVVNVAQRGGLAAVLEAEAPSELATPTRAVNRTAAAESELRRQIGELRHLDHTIALLGWDEETMLPALAREERGEQLATLEGLRHALLTANSLGDLIEQVSAKADASGDWSREIQLLRRLRQQAVALPQDLVRALANLRSQTLGAWEEARHDNDFDIFARPFDELLGLLRDKAAALAGGGGDQYDALLDENEEHMTRARLAPVLEDVRKRLVPLVQEASAATAADAGLLEGRVFHDAGQAQLCRKLLTAIGFQFERGRLDRSTHPFTLYAGMNDVRLTIRVDESNLLTTVLATLHEGGHALYDQGFASADCDSLLGDAPSMGMHECQARLWENHIGRSRAFWHFAFPHLRDALPDAVKGLEAEAMCRAANVVKPGANRICADEMSYHLHIVLRYELEIALLAGTLSVRDLPAAWNERSASLIGVTPSSDRDGVLQDVHWALGSFGYFPSYTLGSIYGAQLMETYARDHALDQEIERGEFASLLEWLHTHVHRVGHRFGAEQIVANVTGNALDPEPFFRYLQNKIPLC